MANDSSTGGYLLPDLPSPPLADDPLDDVLQAYVAGLSGIPGDLVRPRWQPVVPKQPEPTLTWCALGVMGITSDFNPTLIHDGTGLGQDVFIRHETIAVLCSFYGPAAMQGACQMRDGIYLEQNNDLLIANEMALMAVDTIRTSPELVNMQWIKRYDMPITLRRKVTRTYPVRNLLSAPFILITN